MGDELEIKEGLGREMSKEEGIVNIAFKGVTTEEAGIRQQGQESFVN